MRSATTFLHLGTLALLALSCGSALCGLAACQSTATIKDTANMTDRLIGTWTLATIGGTDVASQLSPQRKAPSLTFTTESATIGKISGSGGINRLNGSFDPALTTTGSIKLDRMISTRMAGEPAAMQLEARFLHALSKADAFSFDGTTGGLYLKQGSTTLLYFTKAN
jgi:heat shock protein HslJ